MEEIKHSGAVGRGRERARNFNENDFWQI